MVSSEFANFTHRHVGFKIEELIRSALEIAEDSASVAEQVEAMKTIILTPDERGVFASSAHQLIYDEHENAPVRPEQLLRLVVLTIAGWMIFGLPLISSRRMSSKVVCAESSLTKLAGPGG